MPKAFGLIFGAAAVLILGGCASGAVTDQTSSTPATATSATSTTSTTEVLRGLDMSGALWVTHGLDGIRLDDGTLLWATEPFPASVARDRLGGLVFTDSTGLWWYRAGTLEPERVRDSAAEVVAVATTPAGSVAVVRSEGPRFVDLADGGAVESPAGVPVEILAEAPWLIWTATNGLSAWVTEPEVERDSEGQPSQVLEPAHLVVARDEEVLVDLQIGGVHQAWATIHDFDGRTLIVSRGPYEPAMPEETFLVIDLAEGGVTAQFTAGGTRATLTGADVEWDGPVLTPDLGSFTPGPDAAVGRVDGPVFTSPPPPPSDRDGMTAQVMGTLTLDDRGCLMVELEGIQYPIVWPSGTSWQPDPPAVLLPEGRVVEPGMSVLGDGGYMDSVTHLTGQEVNAAATACVGPTGEIAIFNPGAEVTITVG